MALVDFLREGAEPNYFPPIEIIAARWDQMLGPNAFDDVDDDSFLARVMALLESGRLSPDIMLQVIADLGSLSWWRGPKIDDASAVRLSAMTRRVHLGHADSISLARVEHPPGRHPAGSRRVRRRSGPTAALALARRDRLCRRLGHGPAGRADRGAPRRQDQAQDAGLYRRAPGRDATRTGPVPDLDGRHARLPGASRSSRGPCTFHFWCEPTMAPHITLAARLGPTVMFTCGDEPPPQYADVFWYFHEPEHMAPIWKRRGAPDSFIQNYVHSVPGPFYDEGKPASRTRADVGLADDAFVIATVGNRLAVDLDEAFVTGLEMTPEGSAELRLAGDRGAARASARRLPADPRRSVPPSSNKTSNWRD
jgi:hypothetical protein